jgi:hypothetical protein
MRANLHQRLKRLEARVRPTDEPLEIVIHLIGPGGEFTGTLIVRGGQGMANGYRRTRRGAEMAASGWLSQ